MIVDDHIKSGVVSRDMEQVIREMDVELFQHSVMLSLIKFAHTVQMLFKITLLYKFSQYCLADAGNRAGITTAAFPVTGHQGRGQDHISGSYRRRDRL